MASAFVCDDGRNAPACKACSALIYVAPGTRGRRPHYCATECRPAKGPTRALLTDRDCAVCGSRFKPLNSRSTCCGTACAKAKADATRSANAAARNLRHCQTCAAPFMPTRNSKGLYCGRACQAQGRRKPRQIASRPVVECAICAAAFVKALSIARLCSAECRKEDARRAALTAAEKAHRPMARSCRECSAVFTPAYGDKRKAFCSDTCGRRSVKRIRRSAERARLRRVKVENVNPITVFDRDRWRCMLCGVKTPRTLRGTYEPNAPELDHIVPLAAGGEHSYRNTQCACRSCNAAKGDRPKGQQRLF